MYQPRRPFTLAAISVAKAMTTTRRRPLIGGLLVSTMAVGLLVAGGTPAAVRTSVTPVGPPDVAFGNFMRRVPAALADLSR